MATRLLAIEGSGLVGSLALAELSGGEITAVTSAELPAGQRSAQSMAPALANILATAGWAPRQVEVVAVTTGPGSFTSLRIAVTTAKAFAYAVGAKVIGVHTLAAMAHQSSATGPIWTVLDAQRGELFAAKFSARELAPIETMVLSAAEWLAKLEPGDTVLGPPVAKLLAKLPAGVVVPAADPQLSATSVAEMAAAQFLAGQCDDPISLLPNYYRLSAAEEKLLSG